MFGSDKPFVPGKWTLIVLLLAAMPALLGTAAVAPALPLISAAFPDVSETMISFIITLPPLATALSGFLVGAISDKYGRKKVLLVSLALFGFAGVSGFFLDSVTAIIFWRMWLGIGLAGLMPTVTTLLTEYYNGPTRARYLGYMSAAMGVGGLVMQTGSGILAEISWREPFLIYLFGILVIPLVFFFIKEPKREEETESVYDDGLNIKSSRPTKLDIKPVLIVYVTLFLSLIMMYLVSSKIAYLLTQVADVSTTVCGLVLGLCALFSAVSSYSFWRFARRFTSLQMFSLMFLMEGLGLFVIGTAVSVPIIALGAAIVGFGLGLGTPTGAMWLSSVTPQKYLGKIMGGQIVAVYFGVFASSFVGAELLALTGTYQGLFLAIGVVGVVIGVVYWVTAGLFRGRRSGV
ncbi:MFS transporter [Methanorbis furvi]|uniref:Sialic acid transporter NanT n=1 Tax=Methanorbis furvi TaxID=3028299 RepID=A0AAE4MCJ5_9EURY|nr:Sialic acid transporter NanT [Methanocorpusculaceae archaeon Ag1]